MMNNHGAALDDVHREYMDASSSWLKLTLSQPSSSSSTPSPSSPPPPSPPKPSPFEYTPLTPPTRVINPQTFFHSKLIISPTQQHCSELDPNDDLISKSLNLFLQEEKDLLPFLSLPNPISHESILPPSRPAKRRKLAKSATIPPPFPWATAKRATVHTLDHSLSILKLKTISGILECKFCKFQKDLQIDLVENFEKVTRFIEERRNEMRDRAPSEWLNPVIPNCESCKKEKAMYPLMTKKRNINWLFLLLSQMIGCCKLEHLKYFCKHADIHRTGAKDRLIYSTYFGLCKQLQPNRPFLP